MNVIILTNIMTPYRRFFYDELYRACKERNINFHVVLMARTEPDRNWVYENYATEYSVLLPHKTVTVGRIFIHLNKGLKKLYKELQPSVVVCAGSYLYPAVWKTLKLRKNFQYKVWYWSESHLSEARDYGSLKLKIREWIRRSVIDKFDGYWYAGKFSREFIEKYCNPEAKFVFTPNLIDVKKFAAVRQRTKEERLAIRKEYGLPMDKKVLLTPARLSKAKGIEEFLSLYKEAKNRMEAVYLLAGDGELANSIKKYCEEYALDVRLLGYKQEEEMLALYAIADAVVLPSLSDPNPLTCIEACWCGLPLLVSGHVGNYPEVIRPGENGNVFNYEDRADAIEKIETLIARDEAWKENAGAISYGIAEEIYNPKKCVNRIIEETIKI